LLGLRACGSSSKEESEEQLGTGREERELQNCREGTAAMEAPVAVAGWKG
jgi:hypothetical protein